MRGFSSAAIWAASPVMSVRPCTGTKNMSTTLSSRASWFNQALPIWKDFAALWTGALVKAGGTAQDYPFWLLTARSMQYAWGANVGMQLIKEVADNVKGHRGVIINTQRAFDLGIGDGESVEIATPQHRVRGRAVLRQGIRPDTLLMLGQFDHWATPFTKDFGVPSMNSLTEMSMDLTDATGSSADIVRVKIAPTEAAK